MAVITVCSDFGTQENKVCHCWQTFCWLKGCITWEEWVKFYLGQNEDCSLGFSTTNSSKRLLQRCSGGRSIYNILVKEVFSAIKHALQRFFPSHCEGICCRKWDPFRGQKVDSFLTLRNELSRRHRCWQSKKFYWKGHLGGEQKGKGAQENCCVMWLAALDFMVMGLVSGLSLANHSDSESFLVAHPLLSQDGYQWEDSGK